LAELYDRFQYADDPDSTECREAEIEYTKQIRELFEQCVEPYYSPGGGIGYTLQSGILAWGEARREQYPQDVSSNGLLLQRSAVVAAGVARQSGLLDLLLAPCRETGRASVSYPAVW
jgi:hypothetical protein